VVTNWRRV